MRSLTLYYTLPILNKYIPISILAYIWTALYRITTRIIDVRIVVKNTSMIVIEWKQQSWMETTLVPIQRHLPPKHYDQVLERICNTYTPRKKGKAFFLCVCLCDSETRDVYRRRVCVWMFVLVVFETRYFQYFVFILSFSFQGIYQCMTQYVVVCIFKIDDGWYHHLLDVLLLFFVKNFLFGWIWSHFDVFLIRKMFVMCKKIFSRKFLNRHRQTILEMLTFSILSKI